MKIVEDPTMLIHDPWRAAAIRMAFEQALRPAPYPLHVELPPTADVDELVRADEELARDLRRRLTFGDVGDDFDALYTDLGDPGA